MSSHQLVLTWGVISNVHLPPGHCWFCSLLSGVLALATCGCRKKNPAKNKSPAICLNHQPILYYLTILQTVGNFFFFVFFLVGQFVVNPSWVIKKTHKTASSVFFQEALKPNGVARIAPHWSSALGLRHIVPSSSSPRPPLVSGPSFVAL